MKALQKLYKSFTKALQKLYKNVANAYMFLKENVDFLATLCILLKYN